MRPSRSYFSQLRVIAIAGFLIAVGLSLPALGRQADLSALPDHAQNRNTAAGQARAPRQPFTPTKTPSILPGPLNAGTRCTPIEALKRKGPGLAAQFTTHTYKNAQNELMPYRLFTPLRLKPGRKYPLVVFLHGAGGSGTDNRKQLEGANMFGALVWTLTENQGRHPCFVVAPQSDVNWPCVILEEGKRPRLCPWPALGKGARLALAVIDSLVATQPIDSRRIYITGHSMGGAGCWHMVAHRPKFFAAAVPVCGLPDFSIANQLIDTPIWNFNGETDEIEPVANQRRIIEEIVKAGGKPFYTEYPGIGHNSFMWAYTEPILLEWLFARHR